MEEERRVAFIERGEKSILDLWKETQTLPEGSKDLGMGEIFPKHLHPNSLLWRKVESANGQDFVVIFATHAWGEGGEEAIIPFQVVPFKSKIQMNQAIADLTKAAFSEWKYEWWK